MRMSFMCSAFLMFAAPSLCPAGTIPEPGLNGRAGPAFTTEYKVLADASSWAAALKSYGLGPDEKEREIYFYDTPSLALYKRGLVLRSRAGKKKADSTVKMRPAPSYIPAAVSSDGGFKCEYDRTPLNSVYSCSLTGDEPVGDAAAVASGTAKPKKLFNGLQESWAGDVWTGLVSLGPVRSYSWEVSHPVFGTLAFERWDLAGGPSFFEISFRVNAGADGTEAKIQALHRELAVRGIKLAGDQSSKTAAAMSFFSK